MLLVLDWEGAGYAPGIREELLRIAAELRRDNALTWCLATLPADHLERGWLLSTLAVLKRASGIRIAAKLAGDDTLAESLAACHVAGLDEAIVVQRRTEAGPAIDAVRSHQRAFRNGGTTVRVWIDGADESFQTQVARWVDAGVTLSAVERVPFASVAADEAAPAADGASRPLRCRWVRSTLNLAGSGALHPCPVHPALRQPAASTRSVHELLAQRETWLQTLGSHPICRTCHRLVRFSGSERMLDAESPFGPGPQDDAVGTFIDHVGGDANALATEALDAALAAFVGRLRNCRGEPAS